MNPDLAATIVAVTLILTSGAVLLFRPVMKKLGDYLEAATVQKRPAAPQELSRSQEVLEQMDSRIRLLEERVHFTEALLQRQRPDAIAAESEGQR